MKTYSGIAVPEKLFTSSAAIAADSAGMITAAGRPFTHPKKARTTINIQSTMSMIC